MYESNYNSGFSLVELLIVLGVFLLLVAGIRPLIGANTNTQVNETASQIISTVRTARERAVARVNNAQHGIFFTINTSGADSMTLYQGSSYGARDVTYDQITTFDTAITATTTLSGTEANFSRGLGLPSTTGTITLSHSAGGITKILTLSATGKIEQN